jgi:hypothetical protein
MRTVLLEASVLPLEVQAAVAVAVHLLAVPDLLAMHC